MPSITSYQTVDAYIGLNLDGVMSYRNLSSSPKQFGVFRIYPKPIFKLRQSKKIVTSDQIFLVLKVGCGCMWILPDTSYQLYPNTMS